MKYFILLTLLIVAHGGSAQDMGMIVHCKMDNTCELSDETAVSPSNGVLMDILPTTNKDNIANSAFLFNSSTSYITLGAVNKLKLAGDKSISFWIYPVLSGSNRTGSIFSYGTGIIIRYEEQGSVTRLNIIFGNTSYIQVNLVQNQWQLVTVTFKKDFSETKSKVYAYINGAQVAEAEQNKSESDFDNSIALIGPANQNALTNGFHGRLDDLKVFNRTLTSTEVLNLVLPVRLEFFRGKREDGSVELSWKTGLEENISHFNLLKSTDGIHFKKISETSAGKYNYLAYDHSAVSTPIAWYQLQIVNKDGKTELSNIIRINPQENTVVGSNRISLFPNPGTKYINLIGASVQGKITIINNTGLVVRKKQFSPNRVVDISDLKPGFYYIILFEGNKRTTSRFIKK